MTGKTPDGFPIEQSGFSVVVLRKQTDGQWLMVIDNPFGDHLVNKGCSHQHDCSRWDLPDGCVT